MSLIKEECGTPPDLEISAGYGDIVDSKDIICLHYVKPLDSKLFFTSLSQNKGHNASCIGSTPSDFSTVTVKLEIGNADEKRCIVANHNASGTSPSIPLYSGESDEFHLSNSNTSDSIAICQHKPVSPLRKAIDDRNSIKKEPCSPTDSSLNLNVDTIVIHSIVDNIVSGNADLENDIAGKPLYSISNITNNTPHMDSDFKRVKREPAEVLLAAQQSVTVSNKPTLEDRQIAEIMSGKLISKVIIQRLESNWMRNGCKNNGNSCNAKRALPNEDPNSSSQGQKDVCTCQLCDSVFSTNLLLEGHMKDCHKKQHRHRGKRLYKCTHCDNSFSQSSHLQRHMRTHTKEKPYKCNHCGKNFSRSDDLRRHIRTHTNEKPYTCSRCNKNFCQNAQLHSHMRTHTGEKLYTCSHCDKSFGRNSNLHRHVRTHTVEKPYKCTHCDQKFSRKENLHHHMRRHTGEKPFKCSRCTKSFSRRDILHSHMRTHTKDKPHTCSHCDQNFSRISTLHKHMRTHTKEKPYTCTCSHCGKMFCGNNNLHRHMRTHTGEKTITCNRCDKNFRTSGQLHVHMRTHT